MTINESDAAIASLYACLEKQREEQELHLAWLEAKKVRRDAIIVELARTSPEKIAEFIKLNMSIEQLDNHIMKLLEPVGSC